MADDQTPGTVGSPCTAPGGAVGGYLEPIRAAGAVLWREGSDGRAVALVHRPARDDWSLPKGKLKNGEHVLSAAVREVGEETGLRPVLGRRLPSQRYLKNGWPKQVEWWAATATDESVFQPTDEVDALEWFPLARARERLSYDHDRQVLDDFCRGPARTVPLILLRHGSAGEKNAWADHDLLRPLDGTGRADALALATVLGAFGVADVVSSAAARCTETVLPYSVMHTAEVRTERSFTTGTTSGAPSFERHTARKAFAALLAERSAVLVCTHGELVADLMRETLLRSGAPVSQQLSLRKGTFWVVHVGAEDGALAAVERHAARG
ncbi:NUDIX hydrolase [Nocardiopsis ansamitocini]|uniref:8-oxo-dGTP diphosphatase 1 n=1 Tax=Nocardiopsis ansamitocini TaxID=1670832 RepID=A0A9W6UIZ8_9ACTN|nr:NUDIX domain-containing protein [Nocardiopsis ansamitocini]GLU47540.1 putative 8-oxo-dGTP diphosphatase 1 [Nocardiopsis ansamitocini]